jgi:hypothetical protein
VSASNVALLELEHRLARVEEELSRLTKNRSDESASMSSRLRKLKRPVMVAGIVAWSVAVAQIPPGPGNPVKVKAPPGNVTLQQYVTYNSSSTPAPNPLDSLAVWSRDDSAQAPYPGETSELLSLISDGTATNSNQWPLFIELRGTTSPAAITKNSQGTPISASVGSTVRTIVRSTGSPWTVGYHSEVAHGETVFATGTPIATNGTSILYNGEIRSFSTGGVTTGVNLQCVYQDSTSRYCSNGINIQTGAPSTFWQNGIHFDTNGNYFNGNIGINFDQAQFHMGIDLANNSLRMNAGQKIVLEKYGQVWISYNQAKNTVEIWKNGLLAASF